VKELLVADVVSHYCRDEDDDRTKVDFPAGSSCLIGQNCSRNKKGQDQADPEQDVSGHDHNCCHLFFSLFVLVKDRLGSLEHENIKSLEHRNKTCFNDFMISCFNDPSILNVMKDL